MSATSTADAWRQDGVRSDRSAPFARPQLRPERDDSDRWSSSAAMSRSLRPAPPLPPLPPLPSAGAGRPPRRSSEDDMAYRDDVRAARAPAARLAADRRGERHPERGRSPRQHPGERRPSARSGDARGSSTPPRGRPAPANQPSGSRLRGIVAVLAVFVVTLAGGAVDSLFMGMGLGLMTLGCLVGSTILATALVRRSDLISVVIAPPLVFMAVAATNIAVAPSAAFNLPTLATLLIRGFPAMAMATGAAVVVALVRWAARR